MKLKEAILISLKNLGKPSTYMDVYNDIIKETNCTFNGKTPQNSVAAALSLFISEGDSRVKCMKPGKVYLYYLTENENSIDTINQYEKFENSSSNEKHVSMECDYKEKDLHELFVTYLNSINVRAKTINHTQSKNSVDNNQTWTHPDIIGIKIIDFKTDESKELLKRVNAIESFELSSYELKREIRSDSDLKMAYFQAVSNSSWANYGYLVMLELDDRLINEMERLNKLFGIGIIQLKSYPYKSRILFQAKRHDLDFQTIDKLCNMNSDFKTFIGHTRDLICGS